MSFTTEVCEELASLATEKNCCKKALVCGLFWQAKKIEDKRISARFKDARSAEYAAFMLESRYSASAEIENTARAGRMYYTVSAECLSVRGMIDKIESDDSSPIWQLLGFHCGNCRAAFLRGVFISSATLNDPKKSYRLEFSVSDEKREKRLCEILSVAVGEPKRTVRGKNIGLYYKTNADISGLVYYVGGTKASFDITNAWVERDIRNDENRATNCDARNISRVVNASQKQVAAIEQLKAEGRFDALAEELKITAELRVAYDSVSLSELALLHDPPISKSGLNQRLSRILKEVE